MRPATRMQTIGTESAFEVSARARALEATGRSIIHLQIGEPDFDTPANVREAAKRALDEGATHYAPFPGIPQLREAIAEDATARKGFAVTQAAMYIDSGIPSVVFGVLQIPEIIGAFSKFGGSAAVKAYIAPGRNASLSIAETSNGDCNLHFEVTGVLVNP